MSRFRLFTRVAAMAVACAAAIATLRGQPSDSPVWRGAYTASQAERGKARYLQHCSRCHGEEKNFAPNRSAATVERAEPL